MSSPRRTPVETDPSYKVDTLPSDASVTLEKEDQPNSTSPPSENAPENEQTEPEAGDGPRYITGTPLFIIMASMTLVAFLMLLDMSIIATAIPQITTEFKSLGDVGWYGSAYNLASAALQPLSGKLYTHFRTKWIFMMFVFVFLLGSLLCGVATSSKMFIVGRAVAGMGTSGIQNGALTVIADSVPLHKRPALTGALMGIGQIGIIVGPLLGGAITEYSTWRWCFYLNLPAGAVSVGILLLTKIPDRRKPTTEKLTAKNVLPKLDLPGFALFAPAAIMFLLALEYGGQEYAWNSATVIGLFVGAGVTFAIFFGWEHREGMNAMIPTLMLAQREVWTSSLVGLLTFGGLMFISSYFIPIYFQAVGGVSPLISGVYTLPALISNLICAVLSGVLVGKLGYYIPWTLFSAVVSAIAYGILTTLKPSSSRAVWIGYQIVLGIGRGSAIQMPLIAIQTVLSPDQIPVGMAVLIFSQTFGGAVMLSVANTIFNNNLRTKLGKYVPGLDVGAVIAAGANGFRKVVTSAQLPGVLRAYSDSIDLVFWLGVASACVIFVLAWGMGWNDVRQKKKPTEAAATTGEGSVATAV